MNNDQPIQVAASGRKLPELPPGSIEYLDDGGAREVLLDVLAWGGVHGVYVPDRLHDALQRASSLVPLDEVRRRQGTLFRKETTPPPANSSGGA